MAKIYVGNLSWGTTENELSDLFAKFGSVESARIIKDKETGRSKGFGFVEMTSSEDMAKAIGELDGTEFKERTIRVSEARPSEGGGGGGFRRGGGDRGDRGDRRPSFGDRDRGDRDRGGGGRGGNRR
ncbi:MAG: RNA-binding protein [Oligoflexia bacterium]|nr:RNA-binding protein [Oligoflexia bacterium]